MGDFELSWESEVNRRNSSSCTWEWSGSSVSIHHEQSQWTSVAHHHTQDTWTFSGEVHAQVCSVYVISGNSVHQLIKGNDIDFTEIQFTSITPLLYGIYFYISRHSIQSVNTQGQAHVSGVLPKKPKQEENEGEYD